MAMISSVSGLRANWMLHPPAKLPRSRMMAIEVFLISWNAVSLSVIAGATVMESPVCTPIGSKFSTVQMMATLSFESRKSSSSNSFHPMRAFSTSTSCMGDAVSPRFSASSRNSLLSTKPPPVPPSVKDGRITSGKPISCANSLPSRKEFAVLAGATGTPI